MPPVTTRRHANSSVVVGFDVVGGLRLGDLDGLEVSGLWLGDNVISLLVVVGLGVTGDTVGSDEVGLEVTGLRLGDLDGLEVSGLWLGDTVGSDIVGLEVMGFRLGDLDGLEVSGLWLGLGVAFGSAIQ